MEWNKIFQNVWVQLKKIKISHVFLTILTPVLVLIAWEILVKIGIVNPSILPAPTTIGATWKKYILNGKYPAYLMISVSRFLKGFVIGVFGGLLLGIGMGISRTFNAAMTGIVGLFRPIPVVGWISIVMLLIGAGETAKVVLISIGCFWSVFVNTLGGIKGVDSKYLEVARMLEKNKLTRITKVILPAALPAIIMGIREGFGNSWRAIVSAEMIATSMGVGFLISYGREMSRPDLTFIGLASIALIGLILDLIVLKIQDIILESL